MKGLRLRSAAMGVLCSLVCGHVPINASDADIRVQCTENAENQVKVLTFRIKSQSGVRFLLYLTSKQGKSSRLLAVLGYYSVPENFPEKGFEISTEVSVGSFHEDSKRLKFRRAYVTKIVQSPELGIYGTATQSKLEYESQATVADVAFLRKVEHSASSHLGLLRLADWVLVNDPTTSSIQLHLAYAKDLSESEFNRQLHVETSLPELLAMHPYPITFKPN